ncbi:MAG TPA: HupE/UreJ family protein [Terriglobales bacterium]|nr:HupE/UreJ family protein [Terriglobales bacterium]
MTRALLGGVLLLMAAVAAGHDRGTSYSAWTIRGRDAHVIVRISELEISRFPWASEDAATLDQMLRLYFADRLQLRAGERRCAVSEPPHPLTSVPAHRSYEWRLRCEDGPLSIRSELMLDVSPSHLHFARLTRDGGAMIERVLSDREPMWTLDSGGEADAAEISDYVGLGVEHILTGYDHLAFVAALLLIASSAGEVARVVTGFTVAHTITLGLMALGYLRPESAPIEALIGLSIALVAAENIWRVTERRQGLRIVASTALALFAVAAAAGIGNVSAVTLAGLALFTWCYFGLLTRLGRAATLRWGIAFLFGLIHGFGFAGMLTEAGLPQDRTLPALLGFNLGVELGQLAVVALAWPILRWLARHRLELHRWTVEAGSAAVFALGLYWFLIRTYG